MTTAEFDDYLQSIGGLISAYKSDDKILKASFFEFDTGWYAITKTLIEELIALGWDRHIAQAKEKFGTGRFYIGGASDAVYARIQQWEQETAVTCESCGTTENVSLRGHSWLLTMCGTCFDEWERKRNEK